jgi:NAD(P)-dependent dehydrogenase (short-subunit alcohol dehydrogenase family)
VDASIVTGAAAGTGRVIARRLAADDAQRVVQQ